MKELMDPTKWLSMAPFVLAAIAIIFVGLYAIVHDGVQGPAYINFLEGVINVALPVGSAAGVGHAIINLLQNKQGGKHE